MFYPTLGFFAKCWDLFWVTLGFLKILGDNTEH